MIKNLKIQVPHFFLRSIGFFSGTTLAILIGLAIGNALTFTIEHKNQNKIARGLLETPASCNHSAIRMIPARLVNQIPAELVTNCNRKISYQKLHVASYDDTDANDELISSSN